MKIAIINDTHAGARGDSPLFNEYFFKFWENTFFPYLKENNITTICHLGDVVDRRKFINYVTLNSWRKRFFNRIQNEGIDMHILVGNHDVTYKNTNDINAMNELFVHYNNVSVYINPVDLEFDGTSIGIVPWINSENYQESMEFLKNTKSEIIFGHFEIAGFEMDRGNVCHSGLERGVFDRFDMVLSGHFHHKSSSGAIHYLGNQYEMTWADYDDTRGFHVFDTDTRELTFVANPYKMFHKVYYDDETQDSDYWKNKDFLTYKDCCVKVVVISKTNPYLFDGIIDKLYEAGAADISIVEDFSQADLQKDDENIDQTEDTMTILSKYIDSVPINVDSEKMKTLMREMYVEAINLQNAE